MVKNKDGKPRGRMSSYAFFVQKTREDFKKKNPNEQVGFSEFSKKCSEQWKKMSESEKKKFVQMADKDRKRYDNEMAGYVPSKDAKGAKGGKGGKDNKKEKKAKDPDAPKRPLTAFFWYSNDERARVRASMPGGTAMGDVAKELSKKWNALEPAAKAKYEQLALKDKNRYEKELAAYKAKGGGSSVSGAVTGSGRAASKGRGKAASKKKVESSEEESDDDDDDDEDDDENENNHNNADDDEEDEEEEEEEEDDDEDDD